MASPARIIKGIAETTPKEKIDEIIKISANRLALGGAPMLPIQRINQNKEKTGIKDRKDLIRFILRVPERAYK